MTSLRSLRILPALIISMAVVGCADTGLRCESDESVSTPTEIHVGLSAQLAGTASCSGRGCHGSVEERPPREGSPSLVRQNEYTEWLAHDKHSLAYETLTSPRSKQIAKLLNDRDEKGEFIDADKNTRCLVCHTVGLTAMMMADSPHLKDESIFGVGCEACHGSAEKWLQPHTLTGWSEKSPKDKEKSGMTNVADVLRVADKCVGCHVGSAPNEDVPHVREVNHDLIAAGHPRLNFEFTAYMHDMPSHGKERRKQTQQKTNEAQAWAVGQIVSAEAALRLLAYRADNAIQSPSTPWPEFAEYNCYACHHDLAAASWRQEKIHAGNRRPGAWPWGTWYYSGVRHLLPEFGVAMEMEGELKKLEEMMSEPSPSHAAVAEMAKAAAKKLCDWRTKVDGRRFDAPTLRNQMKNLADKGQILALSDWDMAAQVYLALAALDNAHRPPSDRNAPSESVKGLLQALNGGFVSKDSAGRDKRFESPKDFGPISAKSSSAESFHEQLRKISAEHKP